MEASMKPDTARWVVIYPIYINSKKTLAEGRRISASKACENPTVAEISASCLDLSLSCATELDKAYSRDFMQRGRVRVQLKRGDGSLVNPDVPTHKVLFLKVAELVPKHHLSKKQEHSGSASAAGKSGKINAAAGKSGKSGKKKKK